MLNTTYKKQKETSDIELLGELDSQRIRVFMRTFLISVSLFAKFLVSDFRSSLSYFLHSRFPFSKEGSSSNKLFFARVYQLTTKGEVSERGITSQRISKVQTREYKNSKLPKKGSEHTSAAYERIIH